MARRKRRRRYRFKPRFFIIMGLLLLTAVCVPVLLFRSCGEEKADKAPDRPKTPRNEVSLSASPAAGEDYMNSILYIGDSRTLGLAQYGYVPSRQVLAEEGLDHKTARTKAFLQIEGASEALTIKEAVSKLKAKVLLVSFGINGISYLSEEEFFEEYRGLIDDLHAASPQSTVVVQSIYPVTAKYAVDHPDSSNDKIARYNKKLIELCIDRGCYYLNTADKLRTPGDDSLDAKYAEPDGLHINTAAYEDILLYIEEHPALPDAEDSSSEEDNSSSKDDNLSSSGKDSSSDAEKDKDKDEEDSSSSSSEA